MMSSGERFLGKDIVSPMHFWCTEQNETRAIKMYLSDCKPHYSQFLKKSGTHSKNSHTVTHTIKKMIVVVIFKTTFRRSVCTGKTTSKNPHLGLVDDSVANRLNCYPNSHAACMVKNGSLKKS